MSKFYSTNSFCIFSMLFPKHYTKFLILNGSKISSKGSTSYADFPQCQAATIPLPQQLYT